MKPYLDALKKKKFEQMQVTPVDPEQMEQDAANGDGAPMIMEGEMANSEPMAALGEMADENLPLTADDLSTFQENAEDTTFLDPMNVEEIMMQQAPVGKPKSLRDRVLQQSKGRR